MFKVNKINIRRVEDVPFEESGIMTGFAESDYIYSLEVTSGGGSVIDCSTKSDLETLITDLRNKEESIFVGSPIAVAVCADELMADIPAIGRQLCSVFVDMLREAGCPSIFIDSHVAEMSKDCSADYSCLLHGCKSGKFVFSPIHLCD